MDNIREKVKEHSRNRNKKYFIALVVLVIVVAFVVMIEKNISMSVTDVTISKAKITESKAIFVPVKQLDTNIIAVKLSDGSYKLAFDECTACFAQYQKRYGFKNNADNTGLVCKKCKSEVVYEEMGYDTIDLAIPYPIFEHEITVTDDSFVLPKEYLENHQQIFNQNKAE